MDETIGNQRLSYVYCSFDTKGRFYIGSRLCPAGIKPAEDTGYTGSYSYEGFTPSFKEIILVSESLAICREFEALLQFDLISDKCCVNKSVFPLSGNAKLYPTKCPKIRRKLSETRKGKPLTDPQVKHLQKVNAKQKKGGHPRADKSEYPFINLESGEYFFGTIFDLCEFAKINLHQARMAKSRYANSRFRQEVGPWTLAACCLKQEHLSLDQKFSLTRDGCIVEGFVRELPGMTGLFLCEVYCILMGKIRRGWKLNDYP